MKLQIKILHTVLERLKTLNDSCSGKLFGIFAKHTLIILGLQLENESGTIPSYSLPAEIDFCGVFEAFSDSYNSQQLIEKCSSVEVTDNPVLISVKLTIQNDVQCNLVCNNQITKVSYTLVTQQEAYSQFCHVRLQGDLFITAEPNEQSISESFTALRKHVASGVMAYTLCRPNIILVTSDSENGIVGLSGDPTFGEICQDADGEGGQKRKKYRQSMEIVKANMLKRVTHDSLNGELKGHSPIVVVNKNALNLLNIPIKIDFLATISKVNSLSKLYDILLEGVIKYLRLYESVLQQYLKVHTIRQNVDLPETLHFFPTACGHFLTRIIFNSSEENMKKEREMLHDALLLPKSAPIFRKSNRYQFCKISDACDPLLNVHEGVKSTNNAGKIVLVKGNYEYYHYCQNKMDDNGWGCAYRSLQTLVSWFKLQGYIDRDVPSFKDIQKCLVDMGDKPSNFIDSRQWIGSTEVSYVLNSLLGVTSKILFVSSGEEMGTKGPELVNHFETQGTPVMIGGGVLAHTILGVDYNQQTGILKFLVLDPHYTGGEDLNVIQNKGWCGWKSVEFWDKRAYYNMCLPQAPREI
ncbi:ufm1-specific protease 2 [Euwallacea similis]|uniref:ufm1-specific protease 2 n=1 Tax=Euwallacea similis TaxID=1736056 RepID=UPI00345022C7